MGLSSKADKIFKGKSILIIRPAPDNSLHPHDVCPPLDIGYTIALLKREGYICSFIDYEAGHKVLKTQDHDILFIQVSTTNLKNAFQLAKRAQVPVYAFGQHPSAIPDLPFFSGVLQGEPESVIPAFLKNRPVPVFREKGLVDVTQLPSLDHSLFPSKKYYVYYPVRQMQRNKWGFILTGRGCPHKCIYCSQTLRVSYGSQYRSREVTDVVDEAQGLKKMGRNALFFVDDNFCSSKSRTLRLCDGLSDVGLPWVAQTRADLLDEELIISMKDAGCQTLCIGVESGSQRILDNLKKEENVEQIKEAFRLCRKAGIMTVAFFMIGNPTETIEEVKKSQSLCKILDPDMLQVAFFTAYPGSPCFSRKESGPLSHHNFVGQNFSEIPTDVLVGMQKYFYKKFYLSPAFFAKYFSRRLLNSIFNPGLELALVRGFFRLVK